MVFTTMRLRPARLGWLPLLAFAAALIGLLLMHSTGTTSHATSISAMTGSSASQGGMIDAAEQHSMPTSAQGLAPAAVYKSPAWDHACEALGCALMMLACLMLFVVASIAFLTRSPSGLRYLQENTRDSARVTPRPSGGRCRPSLSVLSVYRI